MFSRTKGRRRGSYVENVPLDGRHPNWATSALTFAQAEVARLSQDGTVMHLQLSMSTPSFTLQHDSMEEGASDDAVSDNHDSHTKIWQLSRVNSSLFSALQILQRGDRPSGRSFEPPVCTSPTRIAGRQSPSRPPTGPRCGGSKAH